MARYGQRENRENTVIIKMNHDLKLMGPGGENELDLAVLQSHMAMEWITQTSANAQ